jgi:DNA-binding Xre family transcriptional regulator
MARRRLNFHWHLRRVMAAHDLWKTTQLAPLLRERGIDLSETQVYRLVAEKPERLSMRTLVALCDIFGCTPADLIEPYVEATDRAKKAEGAGVVDIHPSFRPERARILDE